MSVEGESCFEPKRITGAETTGLETRRFEVSPEVPSLLGGCIELKAVFTAEDHLDIAPDILVFLVLNIDFDLELPTGRASWARLLRRVFEVDPLTCPNCGAEMKVIAVITDPGVVDRIRRHLEETGRPGAFEARAPPPPPAA